METNVALRGPRTRFPVKVERELREVLAGAGAVMRVALDAVAELVTVAAGGPDAVF